MSYTTPFNWSTATLSLPENYLLVRITSSTAGNGGTLTLPQVTSASSYIEYGYEIVILDTGGYVTGNGVTIEVNPSDTGYLIDNDNEIGWSKTNEAL